MQIGHNGQLDPQAYRPVASNGPPAVAEIRLQSFAEVGTVSSGAETGIPREMMLTEALLRAHKPPPLETIQQLAALLAMDWINRRRVDLAYLKPRAALPGR